MAAAAEGRAADRRRAEDSRSDARRLPAETPPTASAASRAAIATFPVCASTAAFSLPPRRLTSSLCQAGSALDAVARTLERREEQSALQYELVLRRCERMPCCAERECRLELVPFGHLASAGKHASAVDTELLLDHPLAVGHVEPLIIGRGVRLPVAVDADRRDLGAGQWGNVGLRRRRRRGPVWRRLGSHGDALELEPPTIAAKLRLKWRVIFFMPGMASAKLRKAASSEKPAASKSELA